LVSLLAFFSAFFALLMIVSRSNAQAAAAPPWHGSPA
jgi:hypothetical protein